MAYTTVKSIVLLILLAASIVPNSAARIGKPSPSVTLSSSMPAGQFPGAKENFHFSFTFAFTNSSSGAPGLPSIIEIPTSTSTALKGDLRVPSVFDHVRNIFWDRRSADGIGRQEPSIPASFTVSSTNITITTTTIPSTSTFSPLASAPAVTSSSVAAPISPATSTVTKTISGIVILFTTIVSSEIESTIGTLPPPSLPSVTSLAPPASLICTEAFCTPSSSAISWTCPDTVGCGFSTTLASYSCSTGIACTFIPVTTTWNCSIPLVGNICTTAVPLVPLPSSGALPTSITGPTGGTPPIPPSTVSTASGNVQSATKSSNPTSSSSSSGTSSNSLTSNTTPTAAAITTAASDSTCSDASCCPHLWDCIPTSTASANVLTGLACPTPAIVGKVTGHSWAINCVPSSLSDLATKTDFSNNNACPPYKTCVLPSTTSFQTDGSTGGTTGTALQSVVELPCLGSVAVCTSAFPSLTQLDKPSCMVGEVPGFSSLCDQCSTMKFPEDCPVIENVPWPTTGFYYCACSKDSTGLALNSASGPSGASPSCSGWNYTSTTEVVGLATITTSYNPFWDTCNQLDVKTSCGTAASCTTIVRYEAESSTVTYVLDGVTYTSLIFWWTCKSDLCNVKWWENLVNAFCRFIGICHIPIVSGDGFPRPPWPDVPPIPDPAGFTSDPEGKKTAPSSGSSSTTSSSSCSANTVTDVIVYCYNTTISGGVFTRGCSTTSSFATSGCSLNPTTTTTTESACSVGVVTVTDVGVGCFNITDSVGGFTLTCNQTSTYLSTGCTLTPTTSTITDNAPACLLSPNYDDPAILSDLSIWLQQFPLTLPPDTINFNFTTTAPNATLPPSTTSAGWTSVELITTTITGTNPTAEVTEVLSESVDLWGGVTTVISGIITDYINATSSSILAEATISTIAPMPKSSLRSIITTTLTVTTKDILGKSMVVSEVEIIYGIQSSDPSGTSTSVVTSSRISTLGTTAVLPTFSTDFATTSTNSGGKIWSESVAVVDGSTQVITKSTLASGLPATSCDTFKPSNPTAAIAPNTLQCNFDVNKESYKTGWETRYVPEGMWWINANEMYKSGGYIDQFCGNVTGPTSPGYIIGPVLGTPTDEGAGGSGPPNYVNSIHKSFNTDTTLYWPWVTFSVTFEAAACSDLNIASVDLGNVVALQPASMCRQRLGAILGVPALLGGTGVFGQEGCWAHCGDACDAARNGTSSDPVYSPGGSLWNECLVWTVASIEGDPPTSCPNR